MKRYLVGLMFSILLSAAGANAGQRFYEVGTAYMYYPWTSDEEIVRDLETTRLRQHTAAGKPAGDPGDIR